MCSSDAVHLGEEAVAELGLQAEHLLDLRQGDHARDADREADDDRVGHAGHEPAQPRRRP